CAATQLRTSPATAMGMRRSYSFEFSPLLLAHGISGCHRSLVALPIGAGTVDSADAGLHHHVSYRHDVVGDPPATAGYSKIRCGLQLLVPSRFEPRFSWLNRRIRGWGVLRILQLLEGGEIGRAHV